MPALLDVNVLVALFDPDHLHHEAAHTWFRTARTERWATCPMTESGFVRVLSNPAYPGRRTTMEDAVVRLRSFCSDPGHVFWMDALNLRERGLMRWNHVPGHRQLTDIYLLALAVANKGRLATFDATISIRAVDGAGASHLEVIVV